MSQSPFAGFNLSTLIFQIGDGVPDVDETGNFVAPARTMTVKAFLMPANRQGRIQMVPGEILNQQELVGRFVEPFRQPADLLPGMRAEAVVNGIHGSFVLALSVPDSLGIGDQLGDPITGLFSVTTNRGSFYGEH
ncbi:MAG: hypothetical protein ACHWZW_02905 [Spirulina sp.]